MDEGGLRRVGRTLCCIWRDLRSGLVPTMYIAASGRPCASLQSRTEEGREEGRMEVEAEKVEDSAGGKEAGSVAL